MMMMMMMILMMLIMTMMMTMTKMMMSFNGTKIGTDVAKQSVNIRVFSTETLCLVKFNKMVFALAI